MITWIRTAKTLPGRLLEGVDWGKEIETTIQHITGKKLVVATTFGGTMGEIAWIGQFADGTEVEEFYSKVTYDHGYQSALTTARVLFVPASANDQMWRHV
jgi:hypothetical protein